MHRRWRAAIGSAATVVLAGVSGALINELHGGWEWFVAAGGVVLLSAVLTGWLTLRSGTAQPAGDWLGPGAVKAGRDIRGPVTTRTELPPDRS